MDKESLRKLRGGYSTPPDIARFLVEWAVRSPNDTILEPSCGNGVFLEEACRRLSSLGATVDAIQDQILGIEIETDDFKEAKNRLQAVLLSLTRERLEKHSSPQLTLTIFRPQNPNVLNADLFDFFEQHQLSRKFDVVVGNPPFIRYQNWKAKSRDLAFEIMENAELKPNRLTNAWVPFVLASSLFLGPNGRLAMVVPAELLQVSYAAQLRLFLSKIFHFMTILTFKKLIFPAIQQEVILLLAEGSSVKDHGINVIELEDEASLETLHLLSGETGTQTLKPIEPEKDKWTQYFLSRDEILLLREIQGHDGLTRFGDIASVDVGIVTGKNRFFVIDIDTVRKFKLNDYVIPLVGRTAFLKGVIFMDKDWRDIRARGVRCHLLRLQKEHIDTATNSNGLLNYLEEGKKKGVHEGYKCRIRKFWYAVPSIWVPDAFLYRQIHSHPKLVFNSARVVITDTLHRVKFKEGIDARTATSCFHNSLTFAFSEVLGRSYGGGVLELEPNEAEELPIPYFDIPVSLDEVDRHFRENKLNEVLDMMDGFTLIEKVGLSQRQVGMLREIWRKLSNRRIQRKRSRSLRSNSNA